MLARIGEIGKKAVRQIRKDRLADLYGFARHIREGNCDVFLWISSRQYPPCEFQCDKREERGLTDRNSVNLVTHIADHKLAKTVLGLAGYRRNRAVGGNKGLDHAIRAALAPDAVDLRQRRQNRSRIPFGRGGIPHSRIAAYHLDAGVLLPNAVGTTVALQIDMRAGNAR